MWLSYHLRHRLCPNVFIYKQHSNVTPPSRSDKLYESISTNHLPHSIQIMGVTVLPIWLVLTGLLDFIGQSTCILTFEDSFKAVYSHTPVLASSRSVVTKMLTEGESPLSAMEYGQKITGKYSSTYASASKATHGKTQAALIEKDLEEKVLSKLYKIQYRKLGDAFTQDAQEKYSDMMNKLLGNLVTAFTGKDETKNWKNSDLLDGLLEPDQNYLIAQQEQLLSKVFNNLNGVYTLLRSQESHSRYSDPKEIIYQLIFGLSDVLTEYLSILEKYKLIYSKSLSEVLNSGNNWIVLFHYVYGRFLPEKDISSVYLMYNFQDSLQQSGFTEEIHGLLNLMQEKNWKKMEDLYLAVQIHSHDLDPEIIPTQGEVEMWERIKRLFFDTANNKFDGPSNWNSNYMVKTAIEELANHTIEIERYLHKYGIAQKKDYLIHLKLTLDMIHHFVQFRTENNGIERIKELKTKSFYPRLQATDKEIKFFHEVLKVAYYKGGELLIAIHHQSLLEPQERVRLSVLQYLTGMNSIQARSGYEKNLEAEYQVNANKGEQRIGLLKSKLLKLTLEQNNSDLNYDSKEHSLISKKCNPWIKSLLDQPIGNKLDHATLGNLIDHPSQEKPENFSQIFNGDPDSKTPSDSYIICNIHNIMKELDLITKSDNDDLFLKQVKINDILKRPALLYQYNVKEQDHGIQRKNTQIFSNQG
ncbi:hypothetical protein MJO29_009766 [Puccinia striiformis f. sp. tritici]|nr:hypothetical protein MJO29_009766 [Puccinia striiformis f. sp. tritici]